MEEYNFIYCNSDSCWNQAKNPVFIAKHTRCRAIPKEHNLDVVITKLNALHQAIIGLSLLEYNTWLDMRLDGILEEEKKERLKC